MPALRVNTFPRHAAEVAGCAKDLLGKKRSCAYVARTREDTANIIDNCLTNIFIYLLFSFIMSNRNLAALIQTICHYFILI